MFRTRSSAERAPGTIALACPATRAVKPGSERPSTLFQRLPNGLCWHRWHRVWLLGCAHCARAASPECSLPAAEQVSGCGNDNSIPTVTQSLPAAHSRALARASARIHRMLHTMRTAHTMCHLLYNRLVAVAAATTAARIEQFTFNQRWRRRASSTGQLTSVDLPQPAHGCRAPQPDRSASFLLREIRPLYPLSLVRVCLRTFSASFQHPTDVGVWRHRGVAGVLFTPATASDRRPCLGGCRAPDLVP